MDCSCRVQQLKGSPFMLFLVFFCSRLCGGHRSDASQRPTWMEKSNSRWGYESSVITWWRLGCNLKVFVGDVFRIKPVKFEPFWTNTHKQKAVPGSTLRDTEQNIKNLLAIRGEVKDMFFLFLPSNCHHFRKKTGINTNVRAQSRLRLINWYFGSLWEAQNLCVFTWCSWEFKVESRPLPARKVFTVIKWFITSP